MKKTNIFIALFSAIFFNVAQAAKILDLGTGPIPDKPMPASVSWEKCHKANQIRFIAQNELSLEEVSVRLGTGELKNIKVGAKLNKGDKTNWLDLGPQSTCFVRIDLVGIAKQDRAKVKIQAKIS